MYAKYRHQHTTVIQQNRHSLIKSIDVEDNDIWDELISNKVMSTNDVHNIQVSGLIKYKYFCVDLCKKYHGRFTFPCLVGTYLMIKFGCMRTYRYAFLKSVDKIKTKTCTYM